MARFVEQQKRRICPLIIIRYPMREKLLKYQNQTLRKQVTIVRQVWNAKKGALPLPDDPSLGPNETSES